MAVRRARRPAGQEGPRARAPSGRGDQPPRVVRSAARRSGLGRRARVGPHEASDDRLRPGTRGEPATGHRAGPGRRGGGFVSRSVARWATVALACLVPGCAVKEPPEPDVVLEDALPETTTVRAEWTAPADDTGAVDDGWIEGFGDPQLEVLVAEAVEVQNPSLRILSAQVDRAAAQLGLAESALKPQVGLGADLSGAATSGDSKLAELAEGGSGGVGIGVSWEADVWGKVRAGASAAEASLQATTLDFEFARQSLVASVAKAWFLATELKLQTQLAEETVGVLAKLTELVETKQEVGQVSMQDVHLARAELASAEEALRQVRSARAQAQRGLEILLGRYPAAEIDGAESLVAVPPPIPVGVPSDVLTRRPDLVAAERRVAAAFFLTEQARLAKLPSFSLSASLGASSSLEGAIADLGAGLFAPLFTGGALESQVQVATADQEAAIAAYGTTVLRAFEEVETALTNERLYAERERYLETSVEENEKAYELAKVRYEVGQTDLLPVLQIQAGWLGARVGLLNVKDQRLVQRVNLHLALGGSFE